MSCLHDFEVYRLMSHLDKDLSRPIHCCQVIYCYTVYYFYFYIVYATTAANGKESSYAYYYDERLKTFLGDLYSVKWMENSDVANLNSETLLSQFGQYTSVPIEGFLPLL